jgi:hypothetical protein
MPQDGEIDLLIATDCISEGQNLQDCDYLINYDIHWNPVRIIQRFGRIDRIGSPNQTIQLVNFWPTPDLNKYINLKNRVEARMALVDIAATAEDNILQAEDLEDLIKQDLRYRDKQLLRLKDEVLDLEDFNESVALGEFTLDDFRIELATYIEASREKLEDAPFGLYALVPPHAEYSTIKSGVIYCLKQRIDAAGNEAVNPLQPYFLVYIRDDGEVRYNFIAPKQVLEIFRALCQGKAEHYGKRCELFDVEIPPRKSSAPAGLFFFPGTETATGDELADQPTLRAAIRSSRSARRLVSAIAVRGGDELGNRFCLCREGRQVGVMSCSYLVGGHPANELPRDGHTDTRLGDTVSRGRCRVAYERYLDLATGCVKLPGDARQPRLVLLFGRTLAAFVHDLDAFFTSGKRKANQAQFVLKGRQFGGHQRSGPSEPFSVFEDQR